MNCLLFATLATVVSAGSLERSEKSINELCTFTFNVPSVDGEPCLPGATSVGDVAELQLEMTQQLGLVSGRLDQILDLLEAIDSGSGGSTDSPTVTGSGVNYIRWGRTVCPDTSQLIYHGYMAKSHYTHAGGGVNYLCLHHNPEFAEGYLDGHQSQSYVYGVEYERHNSPFIDPSLHDHDAPCAACEAQNRSQQLMIPGRLSCPPGWTEEYDGVVMAQHYTQKSSTFVCVSFGIEAINSGAPSVNGGLLYVVEAQCGALPCPDYVSGREISCVVCTK